MQILVRMALRSLMILCVSASLAPLAHADVPPGPPPSVLGEVRFQFLQLKDGGVVRCALYASPGDYLKRSFRETMGPVQGGQAQCVFPNVAPGTYAMAAFHDANNNGKLETGIFGIPTEGVCTSNNAKGHFGPPKFKDASFDVKSSNVTTQALHMYYRR